MIIARLIYALTLVAAILFFILYPPWLSWYLLVLLLLLIPADLFISLPGMLSRGVLMSIPAVLEKDEEAFLKLITLSTKSYPVRCVITRLHVKGDGFSVSCRLRCPATAGDHKEVTIDTSRTGVTVFTIKRISTVSMLGLFSLPLKTMRTGSVLILPPPVKPANTMALQHGTQLRPKPGGGFSEEHDMREYRQGDPVRSIHWKASAKFDSLIIREPLVPPPHSRLVHIMTWNGEAERDLILGRLRWVSEYLLKWQMPFYIRYGMNTTIAEISHETDLINFLCYVLGGIESKALKLDQMPSRFSWVFRIDGKDRPDLGAASIAKSNTGAGFLEREVVK